MLDDQIVALEADPSSDQLKIQRLKRQKLTLKDEISRLKKVLCPILSPKHALNIS